MGVHAHAPPSLGSNFGQFGAECAFLVEEFLGLVAAHPLFQQAQMVGLFPYLGERYLVGAPGAFHRLSVHKLRSCPSLGGAHDQHRPRRPLKRLSLGCGFARFLLDGGNAVQHGVKDRRGLLVHGLRVVAFQRERLVAVAAHQFFQLGMGNPREDRGVGDLVAVQVQDRQDRPVGGGIEKLVGVPTGGQRTGLGLAIAHHAGHNQVRIVERGSIGVDQRVAQFAALVD